MANLLSNRYQVIQVLGSGGFGQTFLAEDAQLPSRRTCVIKQLTPIADKPEIYTIVKDRFQREAVILESLGRGNHQIPELYAYFNEDSKFYLVQEWIDGKNLTQKVSSEGCLSEPEVRNLLTSLLPVLSYVHSRGIIHRDIKPDNIILRTSDLQPVLIDFGAVKETVSTTLNSQGQAASSIVIGTPGFMPSEQAIGRVNFSSDLYSLGLTAIFLLTGKMPQKLDTDVQTGEISWQLYAPRNISANLITVISQAIRFHPRDRYTTAQDMLAALSKSNNIPTPINYLPATPPSKALQGSYPNNSASTLPTIAVNSPTPSRDISPVPTTISAKTDSSRNKFLIVSGIIASVIIGSAIAKATIMQKSVFPDTKLAVPENSENIDKNKVMSPQKTITTAPLSPPNPPDKTKVMSPQKTITTAPLSPPNPPDKTIEPVTPPLPLEVGKKPVGEKLDSDTYSKEAAAQAIQNYYVIINSGKYEAAWKQLTPRFQKNKAGDYSESFLPWWQSVRKVTVDRANLVSIKNNLAIVDTQLTYQMKTGESSTESSMITLIWDSNSNGWLFEDAQP